jgi:ubiquinone/menaquinone biosynthesis C-methylase UbiE
LDVGKQQTYILRRVRRLRQSLVQQRYYRRLLPHCSLFSAGKAANLSKSDAVLDVGCGCGDQLQLWHTDFSPRCVVGLNISVSEVAKCQALLQFNQIPKECVSVVQGDAISLPFDAESFDVVMSLDSAYHYDTRGQFMVEARRCLVEGGRIALGDICLAKEINSW